MSCALLLAEASCTFLIAVKRAWPTEPSIMLYNIVTTLQTFSGQSMKRDECATQPDGL